MDKIIYSTFVIGTILNIIGTIELVKLGEMGTSLLTAGTALWTASGLAVYIKDKQEKEKI